MMRIGIGIATLAALGGSADACPPAVTLDGDRALVGAIHDLLSDRGIEIAASRACSAAAIRAHVTRRGDSIVVSVDDPSGSIERSVFEIATAATVIESFTRDDIGASLLDRHAPPREPTPPAPERPALVVAHRSTRGVQIFGAAETSVGSDRTNWMGATVGACITLGPVCAAARLRIAELVAGDGIWKQGMDRGSTELLVGIDVPFAIGRTTLSPGFAAGLGAMRTRNEVDGTEGGTGGLRADVHATLSVPIRPNLALDLAIAVDFTQETHVESMMQLPDEPLALVRFGVGLRFGGL